MQDRTLIICTIIISLTILESIALLKGVNGILLASVIAVLVQLANMAYGKIKVGDDKNTVWHSQDE